MFRLWTSKKVRKIDWRRAKSFVAMLLILDSGSSALQTCHCWQALSAQCVQEEQGLMVL